MQKHGPTPARSHRRLAALVVFTALVAGALPAGAAGLLPAATAGLPPVATAGLDLAEQHLAVHAALPGVQAQLDLLATTEALLDLLDAAPARDLALGVEVAGLVSGAGPAAPLVTNAAPSEAAFALLARHGAAADAEQAAVLRGMDDAPEPLRGALAGVLVAFVGMEDAAAAAFARDGSGAPLPPTPAGLGAVLGARQVFLASVAALHEAALAAPASPSLPEAARGGTVVPPVLALDLDGVDSTWTDDVRLTIDLGGNDAYRNNGGGSNLNGGVCWAFDMGTATAAVDLAGDDTWGDPAALRDCGANGGGVFGVAALVDAAGQDVYHGGAFGTNGAASDMGVGLLLDAEGNDLYAATHDGVNGGGIDFSHGMLVDVSGKDTYLAASFAANGGGYNAGVGRLLDLGTADETYVAGSFGTNGGGAVAASGFLFDEAGHDAYTATFRGVNGGGYLGAGFLLDAAGNDAYRASFGGSNGGGNSGGNGLLLDLAGDDAYTATVAGANGGAFGGGVLAANVPAATGLLLDAGGRDFYQDAFFEDGATDATKVPKGTAGAQLDSDSPPA